MFVFARVPVAKLAAVGLLGATSFAWAQTPSDDTASQAHALRQIIAALELEAAELEPQVEAARAALSDLTSRIDETTAQLAQEQESLDRVRQEEGAVSSQIETARAAEVDLNARIDAAEASLAELTESIEARRAEADQLTERAGTDAAAEQERAQSPPCWKSRSLKRPPSGTIYCRPGKRWKRSLTGCVRNWPT